MKTNLPVILLKGMILLPNNDIRLEINNELSKSIIDVAELFHDNRLLVVSQTNPLEETPEYKDLPKQGVIAKIKDKLTLPNGAFRIILTGIKRANIIEYLNINKPNENLESIISTYEEEKIEEKEESLLIKKLCKEIENYIITVPYISNSFLDSISKLNSLNKITDIVASNLPIEFERKQIYLYEKDAKRRCELILEDIYRETEMFNREKEIDNKIRVDLENSQKEYVLREKIKYIKEELGEKSSKEEEIVKFKERMEKINFPENVLNRLNCEIERYELLNVASPEINITRTYIDWILDLPWNTYTEDNNNLKEVRKKLDDSHFGMDDVKSRIIEYLAIKKMTNSLKAPIICLVGPPGVGKTSFAKSIGNAINRKFVKISVGGVQDESEIRGHRRTYLGANPGRIIQSMKKAGSNNPIFLIDEIDKISSNNTGDPASALLEVLDTEQNYMFSDNFIEEEYDLSNVMFIATANSLDSIPTALRDRLEIVNVSGYTEIEKLDIAKKYLIPKICNDHGINYHNVDFSDEIILEIIRSYTKEAGVRELERQLSKIIRKIVTSIVITNIKAFRVSINDKTLEKYLGKPKYYFIKKSKGEIGIVNALAYTLSGGDVLPVEVNYFPGKGELILTGSLGEVMKESAQVALSFIKANHNYFKIDYELFKNNDIHIHIQEGAIQKDGPSAGITLTTAIISAFLNKNIPNTVAMTGEITLRGNILPVGGIKEKIVGASRNGIKKIYLPYENKKDLEEVPSQIKNGIEFIEVRDYKELYNNLLKGDIYEKRNKKKNKQV